MSLKGSDTTLVPMSLPLSVDFRSSFVMGTRRLHSGPRSEVERTWSALWLMECLIL